jgi:ankyrin repeat protein
LALLIIAVALGRDKLVQELRQKYFYPDGTDRDGERHLAPWSPRPLDWAAEAGHNSVVKILLQHGFDGKNGEALVLALRDGHLQVAEALLDEYLEVYRKDTSWFNNLLLFTLEHGQDSCFELLLSHGVVPTEVQYDEEPVYLIQLVLESGRESLVQALLRRGFALEIPLSATEIMDREGSILYPLVVKVWRCSKSFSKMNLT